MAKRLTPTQRRQAGDENQRWLLGAAMSFRHDPYKLGGSGMLYWHAWDAHFKCRGYAPPDASWQQRTWSSYLYARYERMSAADWIRGDDPTGIIRLNTVVQTSYGTGPYQILKSHKYTICRCENCYPVPARADDCRHKDDHILSDLFDTWGFTGKDVGPRKRRGPFSLNGYVLHEGEVVSYHGRDKLIVLDQILEEVQGKLF